MSVFCFLTLINPAFCVRQEVINFTPDVGKEPKPNCEVLKYQLPKNENIPPDVDFGPWMKNFQKSIKRNWNPPKRIHSNQTVLVFTISKDGKLLNIRTVKFSDTESLKAAIAAVENSAPFDPLPENFKGKDIDIKFIFDYNVFGKK